MHNYLHIAQVHLGQSKAREAVSEALARLGVKRPQPKDWKNGKMEWCNGDRGRETFYYRDLLLEAQKEGFSRQLYTLIDREDPFFGGTFLMATNSSALKMKVSYAGYNRELQGPCRFSPIENDLTEDILHFRKAACSASASNDYYNCTRHYRSFLQSCISLVDCFINRYAQLHLFRGGATLPEALTKPGTFEGRFDAWIETFGKATTTTTIKQSAEWSQCTMLRHERNRSVHAVEPYLGIQIQDLPRQLNHVRRGIGGLLFCMRSLASQGSLGFIERLRTAPVIEFREKSGMS